MGWQAWVTLTVVVLVVTLLARDARYADLSMLSAIALLAITGIITPAQALSGFSNPAVIMVGAMLVVAAAIEQHGALAFLERFIKPRSNSTFEAVWRMLLPVSLISAFVNNTTLMALSVPQVQRWSREAGIPASKILLPLSYATIMGGLITTLGTSTNVAVSGLMQKAGMEPLALFELSVVGLPLTLAGLFYLSTLGQRLLPDTSAAMRDLDEGFRNYQFELAVSAGSPLAGKTVQEAGIRTLRSGFLAHIRRTRGGNTHVVGPVSPNEMLAEGDVLVFVGDSSVIDRLARVPGLQRVHHEPGESSVNLSLPLFECVVAATSTLVGVPLRDSNFRNRFQGVVLGVQRRGKPLTGPLGLVEVEPGDLLLVEAQAGFERWGQEHGEFYLVAPRRRAETGDRKLAIRSLLVLFAVVGVVTAEWVSLEIAAMAGAIAMVASGCLTATKARHAIDVPLILLLGASFGMGEAIRASGLDKAIAGLLASDWVLAGGAIASLAAVYVATNLLTELISNGAAAALMFPVAMATAEQAGNDARAYVIAVCIAASAGFATPIGYQTNLMVMGSGGYRFGDYFRVGAPLNIICLIVSLIVIPLVWW